MRNESDFRLDDLRVHSSIGAATRFGDGDEAGRLRQVFSPLTLRFLAVNLTAPVLLVLGGGYGLGPVREIVAELDKVARPFQTVVVTGRNEQLRRDLAAQDRKHPTHVLGYASNMHELMAVAELVITKPGGLTSSEVLAIGKPLFVVNPIPGQEAANSDFLLERGAAAKVNRLEDLPHRIEHLLGSKKLSDMAKAARALGRPDAAPDVCRAVLRRLNAESPR